MFEVLKQRVEDSYVLAHKQVEERIASGTQPAYSLYYTSIEHLLAANFFYYFVTFILYSWMKNREKRFEIKWVLQVYNLLCILAAGYVFIGLLLAKMEIPGSFACNPLLPGESGEKFAWLFWVFYAQKFLEFCDTWFFILRKSFRQVTFLHLFHHSSITFVVGLIFPYDYSGDMFLPIAFNAFVHVLMYSHYLATSIGVKSWWSRHLTSLQLIQFIAITTQSYVAYQSGPSCGAPDFAKILMVMYMMSMLILFGNFFVRKYVLKKPASDMCGVIKSVETPSRTIYSGMVTMSSKGVAVVTLPQWFTYPSDVEFSYQLTAIGAAMPSLHVTSEITTSKTFEIAGGNPNARVSWQVVATHTHAQAKKKSQ
eukprot:TRINITY_DN30864_c0_g1_i1.p1 TRINITY_DN30864_c0_g1~~TRINITY_DN30864_c0_g1_i1.p1  ORF type:complete len:368 (+),score=37.97 TRINITY_DN30864_c0_g1_i1:58-1161(+)